MRGDWGHFFRNGPSPGKERLLHVAKTPSVETTLTRTRPTEGGRNIVDIRVKQLTYRVAI
jgi:hypothetical protein